MTLRRPGLVTYRILFALALAVTTYATTAALTSPAVADINDKFAHFATFFILGALADLSFPDRGFDRRLWVLLVLYGLLIEIIQYPIPYRTFSLLDWAADAAGILAYGLCARLAGRPWIRPFPD